VVSDLVASLEPSRRLELALGLRLIRRVEFMDAFRQSPDFMRRDPSLHLLSAASFTLIASVVSRTSSPIEDAAIDAQ